MTKQEFINWAKTKGWIEDKYGNFQNSQATTKELTHYRFKVSNISVRYEVRVHHPAGSYSSDQNEWVRIKSGYFKDLSITDYGKLRGLR